MHLDTQDAIAAALTLGERPAADRLPQAYLDQHPQDESAWLSQMADQPAPSAESLVSALEIRAAQDALPAGSSALAKRLRRLADTVERPPRGPRARQQAALNWAGRGLLAGVLLVVSLIVGPLALGYRPIIIISGSMEPLIHTGSIVVAQPVPSAGLQVGDVIAYMPGANAAIPLVHRIVRLRDEDGTRYYTTRGDANLTDDPNEVPLGATAWRYRYSVPLIGYVVTFASSPNGKIVMIALPLLGLAGLSVVDWLKRRPAALPTRPSAGRLRALPTLPAWLQLTIASIVLKLRQRLSLLGLLARPTRLPTMPALPAVTVRLHLAVAAIAQKLRQRLPVLCVTVLSTLSELTARLHAFAQVALRHTWTQRARSELDELRALLRLPMRSAWRELRTLLRRSVLCELHALQRQPAWQRLRALVRTSRATHMAASAMTRSSRAVARLPHSHRRGLVHLLLATGLALAAAHLQPFVGHALALMGAENSLADNAFSTSTLGAPSELAGNALGHDVNLNWSAGQNGTGYAITGAPNVSSSDCSGATFAAVGTTAAITYTDAGRYSPPGTWFCYQVETSVNTWRSQISNPRVAVQLGFVANAVNLINAGDTAGCNAGEFGAADEMDCGDQVVVGLNQAVDTSTGPDSADTVCAHDSSDTLWLGSTITIGACTAAESVTLGKVTGGALGLCDCRYSASYAWAADSRTLTVTLGTRVFGATDASLSGTPWTLTPSTDAATLRSATGSFHICDTNADGGNCQPQTP